MPATPMQQGADLIARLDRLPRWPHSRWILSILAIGWFFCYFDILTISFALPVAIKHYASDATIGATAVSLGLIGFIAGEVGVGILSDLRGRRTGLFTAVAMYSIGAFLNALAPTMTLFIIARFISGAGIGAFIGVASAYVSEIMPAPIRGRFAAWVTLPAMIGGAVTPFVALALVPNMAIGWRILLALPLLAVVPMVLGAAHLPESLRWNIEHGKLQDARNFVEDAERRVRAKLGGAALPPVQLAVRQAVEAEEKQKFNPMSIFKPPILGFTAVLFMVWFWNYAGVYGFGSMGVTLLVKQGYSLVHSIEMTFAGSLGILIGGVVAPQISDRYSRKWPPFIFTVLLAAETLLLGFAPGPVLITIFYFLHYLQIGIFAPLVYLLTAEHFPTAGRNLGVAISDGVGHIGGAIGPILVTLVYASFGFGAVFLAVSGCFGLCALSLLFTKNTTKRNLEAIIMSGSNASAMGVSGGRRTGPGTRSL